MITAINAALLTSTSGGGAILILYAAEIYPARLRIRHDRRRSEAGGVLCLLGFLKHLALFAALIALCRATSGVILLGTGIEPCAPSLEATEQRIKASHLDT